MRKCKSWGWIDTFSQIITFVFLTHKTALLCSEAVSCCDSTPVARSNLSHRWWTCLHRWQNIHQCRPAQQNVPDCKVKTFPFIFRSNIAFQKYLISLKKYPKWFWFLIIQMKRYTHIEFMEWSVLCSLFTQTKRKDTCGGTEQPLQPYSLSMSQQAERILCH